MLKLMILPRTRDGMSRAELHNHLETVHGPLTMRHEEVGGYFRHYVHHYALDTAPQLFGVRLLQDRDALTIICFDDMAAFQASTASSAYRDEVAPDEKIFSEREGSLFFFAEELPVLPGPGPIDWKIFLFWKLLPGRDTMTTSALWRERIKSLSAGESRLDYRHNILTTPPGIPLAYDFIDEVGCAGSIEAIEGLMAHMATARDDLFDANGSGGMVTRPKVFVP